MSFDCFVSFSALKRVTIEQGSYVFDFVWKNWEAIQKLQRNDVCITGNVNIFHREYVAIGSNCHSVTLILIFNSLSAVFASSSAQLLLCSELKYVSSVCDNSDLNQRRNLNMNECCVLSFSSLHSHLFLIRTRTSIVQHTGARRPSLLFVYAVSNRSRALVRKKLIKYQYSCCWLYSVSHRTAHNVY